MSVTREACIRTWATRWSTLRAWRRDLSLVKVEVSDRAYPDRLGTCWTHQQRVVIYRGDSIADELATLLHEMAHAALITNDPEHHGPTWQATHAAAIAEVTGLPIPSSVDIYQVQCRAAHDAVKLWWYSSGNKFAWDLLTRRAK